MPTATSLTPTFAFDHRSAAIDEIHAQTAIFTASYVVDAILARVGWCADGRRLIDPGCGDGMFIVRALARLDLRTDDVAATDCVRGYEFHPNAVREARARVTNFLTGRGWSLATADLAAAQIIVEADFLTEGPSGDGERFDLAVGNPPYLRWANLPELFKQEYGQVVPTYALNDLLHAFLDRCCAILDPEGVMAFVTSDRWLFNESAAKLRARLGAVVGVEYVARLDCKTCFYRPKIRRRGAPPRIHPIEVILKPSARARTPLSEKPICPDGGEVIGGSVAGVTLGDIASVRLAPWLGPVGVFVVKEDQVSRLAGAEFIPAVDTDDIDPFTDALSKPYRYAIRTTPDEEPTGSAAEHFRKGQALLPARAKRRSKYWLPPESINLDISKPSLLVPRIARKLRAIPLPQGLLPINHNLSVVSENGAYSLAELREIITCGGSQAWIARNAPRLENGFYSITTKLLRSMPVPQQFVK